METSDDPGLAFVPSADVSRDRSSLYTRITSKEIRLLKLHGTKVMRLGQSKSNSVFDLAIWCTLETVIRDDVADGKDHYDALSYVWGDASSGRCIVVNNIVVPVTDNLYAALWHIISTLESSRLPYVLWVDAVCINQADPPEKNGQVRMMSSVFQQASNVMVWLGTGAEQAGQGLTKFWQHCLTGIALDEESLGKAMPAGEAFLERCHWFKRIWTLQEIVHARKATVLCGQGKIEWTTFLTRVSGLLKDASRLNPTVARIRGIEQAKRSRGPLLADLLQLADGRIASDRHDYVYGLASLYKGQHDLNVDYGLPIKQVYAEAAVIMIKEFGSMSPLRLLTSHFKPSRGGEERETFIEDRRNISKGRVYPIHIHSLSQRNLRILDRLSWIPDLTARNFSAFLQTPEFVVGKSWIDQPYHILASLPAPRTLNFELTSMHPAFKTDVKLHGDRLVVKGALLFQHSTFWMTIQKQQPATEHEVGTLVTEGRLFPPCISGLASESQGGSVPDSQSTSPFFSPLAYKPCEQSAKDIYHRLLAHERFQCNCERDQNPPVPGDDPKRRAVGAARSERRRRFHQDWQSHSSDGRGVFMTWTCVLFGSLVPFIVEPVYDEVRDELVCSLVGADAPNMPGPDTVAVRHLLATAAGRVVQSDDMVLPEALPDWDQGYISTPEQLFEISGEPMSFIPTTIELSADFVPYESTPLYALQNMHPYEVEILISDVDY